MTSSLFFHLSFSLLNQYRVLHNPMSSDHSNKRIKCILDAHYRIPPPILMILMGNVPQVSSSIEDVTDESTEESHIIKAPKEGMS